MPRRCETPDLNGKPHGRKIPTMYDADLILIPLPRAEDMKKERLISEQEYVENQYRLEDEYGTDYRLRIIPDWVVTALKDGTLRRPKTFTLPQFFNWRS